MPDKTLNWEDHATGSSGDIELEKAWLRRAEQVFGIFCKKQRSYGPMNIAEFGEKGVILRSNDKLKRLINLRYNDIENPLDDETVEDTWIDIADYGIIGLLCYAGEWPTGEAKGWLRGKMGRVRAAIKALLENTEIK